MARADGNITLPIARDALDMQEIDAEGLDKQDRRYLETLIRVFKGGPTGVEALAATMNVAVDTLRDEVEPYLLRREFVVRSPRGRQAISAAYRHLGLAEPAPSSSFPPSTRSDDCLNKDPGGSTDPLVAFVLRLLLRRVDPITSGGSV